MTNCVLIGMRAGADLPDDSDGITIIGDNVTSLDPAQKNVLFLGNKCAIGTTLNGVSINLKKPSRTCYDAFHSRLRHRRALLLERCAVGFMNWADILLLCNLAAFITWTLWVWGKIKKTRK